MSADATLRLPESSRARRDRGRSTLVTLVIDNIQSMTRRDPPELWDTSARMSLSLVPVVGGALQIIWEDVRAHHQARLAKTIEEVADATGVDELQRRLGEDPEVEALFLQGLDVATRTGLEAKRRLMSRVIAAAVLDEAQVEESQLLVFALRDLDAPHVRALARLWEAQEGADPGPSVSLAERRQLISQAVSAAAGREPSPVIVALHRVDAVRSTGLTIGGLGTGEVTEFGQRLLEDLRAADNDHVAENIVDGL